MRLVRLSFVPVFEAGVSFGQGASSRLAVLGAELT